jgi:GntR family transcriptional regulator, transcriptional repressor for pyruvate dehydrogenase complex
MPAYPAGDTADIVAALGQLPTTTPAAGVARRFLELFTGGTVAPGTRLPSERQLSERLGVGRSAVREALAALEILGIVDVRPGSGTYLRATASELLPQTLRWGLLIGERSTNELLELRSGLEIYAARLAAARADADAQTRLQAHLDEMRTTTADLKAFVKADGEFHSTLAAAAGNEVLLDMLHVVRSLLQIYADRAVTNELDARVALAQHQEVFSAVRLRNPDLAASTMATHMATASSRLSRR